ncbi:MAG: enoyl-CoA hydratase/isomerase family protein [Thermodesulfobacteriota bacterium]|nr:enoyl-CoA hydratase/isomerase family protein [Thermodesulfobacteriota bacterium]
MTEFDLVLYEKHEGIATITFNDPKKKNAASARLVSGFVKAFEQAEDDDDVMVTILTGAGDVFMAGADLTTFPTNIKEGRKFTDDGSRNIFRRLETFPKPVIAAVNGPCLGGGVEIPLFCDITVASTLATFAIPEVSLGVIPGFAVLRLHQLVGRQKAKELIMTCDAIDAVEAYRIGLVNKVVPHSHLMDACLEMAGKIKTKAPLAIRMVKSLVNRELGGPEINAMINGISLLFNSEDLSEGMRSFAERRPPVFKGK